MNDIEHDMFRLGDWSLQEDTIAYTGNKNRTHIASIRHHCGGGPGYAGYTIWFDNKGSIAVCYCGARVPDEIQGLCRLYNMEWIQEANLNG